MKQTALCWIEQSIVRAAEARVSVFDHGLLYGDGVFEGLRFYHGKTFVLEAHLDRLERSAQAISLVLPYARAQIAEFIAQLIDAYPDEQGYLRLVVTRGPGTLGIDPRSCAQPVMFIIADDIAVVDADRLRRGIRLHVANTRRNPAQCLDPGVKSLNYLNNILARIGANRAGMDEALMLNLDGNICEGSVDNLFIVTSGMLRTPPLGDGMLAGVTRAVTIEAAAKTGIRCEENSLTVQDLLQADECFLTGTGAEIIPVREVAGQVLAESANPLTPLLMAAFRQCIEDDCRG